MAQTERADAIQIAQEWVAKRPVFLDTETTDRGPGAEIIEICVLDHRRRPLVNTLVKPTGAISPGAMAVHHITPALLVDAPPWREVWPQVQAALQDKVVAIYNAPFDVQMLQQSHQLSRLRWVSPAEDFVCIMRLYARFHASGRWQKLEAAAHQCQVPAPTTHRARADAELTPALLRYIWQPAKDRAGCKSRLPQGVRQ